MIDETNTTMTSTITDGLFRTIELRGTPKAVCCLAVFSANRRDMRAAYNVSFKLRYFETSRSMGRKAANCWRSWSTRGDSLKYVPDDATFLYTPLHLQLQFFLSVSVSCSGIVRIIAWHRSRLDEIHNYHHHHPRWTRVTPLNRNVPRP